MNTKNLLSLLGIAAVAIFISACGDDESKTTTDDFNVQFVLPEGIYANEETGVTFTVIDGKAPLLTDSFLLEPAGNSDNFYYSFAIVETSPESFTVEISSTCPADLYNVYIMRNGKRRLYGSLHLYSMPDIPLKVLFIGNSFTVDAVNHLPGLVAAAGLKNVKMVDMHYSGRTLPAHYSGYMTSADYTCYTCLPGESSWTTSSGISLHEIVSSDTWDVVTIQEHTGTYYAWEWTDDERNVIQGLIDYIKEDLSGNKPKIEYIMSQAYHDFSNITSSSQSHITFDTREEMFYVIAAQAEKVMAETTADGIISTGAALENLRTTSLNNEACLTRDGYHMDYGIARYAAACAIFETVITQKYGIWLDDNTYRFSDSGTPVTDENRSIALKAARYAIEAPFTITDMSEY